MVYHLLVYGISPVNYCVLHQGIVMLVSDRLTSNKNTLQIEFMFNLIYRVNCILCFPYTPLVFTGTCNWLQLFGKSN